MEWGTSPKIKLQYNKNNNSYRNCEEDDDYKKLNNIALYSDKNHIYFNDYIADETAFALNKMLRSVAKNIKDGDFKYTPNVDSEVMPLYLHIATYGGSVSSAWSVVDCIKGLDLPVYTVVEGFVASAGTLITLSGTRKYITANSYMLVHELSTYVCYSRYSEIICETSNITKEMVHIHEFYLKHTKISKDDLEGILKKDINFNADECISYGLADEVYKANTKYEALKKRSWWAFWKWFR